MILKENGIYSEKGLRITNFKVDYLIPLVF